MAKKLTIKAFQDVMRDWVQGKQTPGVLDEHLRMMSESARGLRALRQTLGGAGLPTDPDSLRTALACKAEELQSALDARDRTENARKAAEEARDTAELERSMAVSATNRAEEARKAAEDARDELRRIINYAIERILKR